MRITLEQMRKLHDIQLDMFQDLKRVMEELDVRYYFVHGSLLSAVTTHQFIEEDDDIDIAVFRKDYERLLEKGNALVSPRYFIQGSKNDDFPLSFGKFRNKETEFDQPILKKHNCNKGIYIDIFPIDYVPAEETTTRKFRRLLLRIRTEARLEKKRSWKQICFLILSHLVYPSYRGAIRRREALYASCEPGEYVTIFGGKATEQKMRACWFGQGFTSTFCGMEVNCPSDSDAYLARIYGKNYKEKNPAEDRIWDDKSIEISASYVDFGDGCTIGQKENERELFGKG